MSDIKNQALFLVIFEDGGKFIGGKNYFDTKWKEIPNKRISKIFYRLPDGNYLFLNGYDKYYHMIEAIIDINGREQGKTKIQYAYIMGQKRNKVTSYRITLYNKPNDRYKMGDILRREFLETDEKIKGLNIIGWKG